MLRASGCRKVRKNGRRDRWTAKGLATLKIWAIGTTRNEADVIRANVLHHLNQGIDRFLILDNGSVDGTCDVLSELAHSFPVEWKQHIGHFRQRELLTRLAREAFVRGADWVMTVDADEFWYAPGSTLRTVLEGSSAGALRVQLVNFVQRREQLSTTRDALLHMTYRPANTVGPIERAVKLFEAGQISFVEHRYVPKWISRTCASLEIGWGMHHVLGVREPTQDTSEIVCLHAPLRSHQVLESKTDLARSIDDIEDYLGVCWHLRRWRRLAREGRLEAEWQANSYLDGQLHRDGQPYPLVYDSTLRDIVAPYIVPKGREQRLVPVPFHVPEPRPSTPGASSTSVCRGGGGRHAVWGVSVVRNEVDIVRTNLLYHLALGLERVLVIDNGSTDGTELVLEELSRELPVTWRRIPGPFRQPELTTELAREAFHGGARWVLPIDADEFWYPCNGDKLESILGSTSATALGCQVINFVQSRDQVHRSPDALLHMTMRPQHVVGPVMAARELVDARRFAYVETRYPPKWITSASADLSIAKGNHDIWPPSERAVHSDAIVVLHAPLRAYAILAAQAEHGRRLDEAACPPEAGWQQRRWRGLADARRLDLEWLANSYYGRHLDVYGQKHMVVEDLRLRDAVRPWLNGGTRLTIDRPAGQARTLTVNERRSILDRIRSIDGWLEDAAAELLIAVTERVLTARVEATTIVELGSYCGRSTVLLGSTIHALDARARVFAIDPHRGEVGALDSSVGTEVRKPTFEAFRRNLAEAGLTRTVEPIVRRSYEVEWFRPIHLIFIDGLHDYLSVSQDLAHFSDWVVPGGYVAFHDCVETFPGVVRCVAEALASGRFRQVEQAESLIVLQKTGAEGGNNR
jgi:glycosyltransferase involved in cell wall biosynthesis